MVRGVAPLRKHHHMRHVADFTRTGFQRLQQPGKHLPRAYRHRDGCGQSPSNDTSRGLLPGDRDQGVERVQGDDTGSFVPRRHGSIVRSGDQRRSIFHAEVTEMKLEDSSLRELKFKDRKLRAVFYRRTVSLHRGDLHQKTKEEALFKHAMRPMCLEHHQRGC